MRALVENIFLLWGWKRYALAALAGAFSVLALPPIGAFPVLFVTFPILLWLVDSCSIAGNRGGIRAMRPAFAIGWWFGFGYFLAGLHWIGAAFLVESKTEWMMPFAILVLPCALALFTGFGTVVARLLWSSSPWRVLALSFGLGLAEVLRGHILTGFPWNSFGYAFTIGEMQMQIANLTGLYGLTILTIFCAASPALLFDPAEQGFSRRAPVMIALALIAVQFGYGYQRLERARVEFTDNVRLRLVQPNLTQEERIDVKNREAIVERLISLSGEPVGNPEDPNQKQPTHIIWPESALPFLVTSMPQVLSRIETLLQPGQILIAGLSRAEDAGAGSKQKNIFNSIYVFGDDAKVINRYDKVHLVPFGEYLPFESAFTSLGIRLLGSLPGYSFGAKRQIIGLPNAPPFLPLICYEIIFPGQITEDGDRAAWLVNLSDDSWFGRSLGPYQHFHQARVRAVEEGLPVVRVTTTGISAVIDAYGRVVKKLPLGVQNVLDSGLPKPVARPPYSQDPVKATFYFLAVFGILTVLTRRRQSR
ncbi:MAG: apolipoprotein N-acyltransferase [Pseudomonadota bacterium]